MLLFVIPLKSPKIARDWSLTQRLVERCVRSVCAQTSPEFRAILVCNEKPKIRFTDPRLEFIEVDFPVPEPRRAEENTTVGYDYGFSAEIERKNADKARKIHTALAHGAQYGPTHSMVVDADDCVSRRLATFVSRHPDAPGWFFRKGYIYPDGGRLMYLNVKNFNHICGSSVIVRYDLRSLLFSKPEFYDHPFDRLPLVPLPFPGTVYTVANGDNIYMTEDTKAQIQGTLRSRIFSAELPRLVQKALKYRPALVTRGIREEFGLYRIEAGLTPGHALSPA